MTQNNVLYPDIGSHLLHDEFPSKYLESKINDPIFREKPYDLILRLRSTPQSPKYHPEGNVWNHTLLVVDKAAKVKQMSKSLPVFMWAALLHDIGKPDTTIIRRDKITSYEHDIAGGKLSREFLSAITDNVDFIEKVSSLIRYHMQILYVVKELPYSDIKGMRKQTDIREVALLGLCDRLGRIGYNRGEEEKAIQIFLQKCGENDEAFLKNMFNRI